MNKTRISGHTYFSLQIINTKDNWLVMGRNKAQADSWLKEYLANASRPFSQLVRRIPIFNKREEILVGLCEHQVPINRGVWFIKMSAAHHLSVSGLITNTIFISLLFHSWRCGCCVVNQRDINYVLFFSMAVELSYN